MFLKAGSPMFLKAGSPMLLKAGSPMLLKTGSPMFSKVELPIICQYYLKNCQRKSRSLPIKMQMSASKYQLNVNFVYGIMEQTEHHNDGGMYSMKKENLL